MKWQRPITYSLFAVAALAIAVSVFNIQICCDWGFICENTGSRKGYRQWTFGPKTGHWHTKSPLEDFMAAEDTDALVHRWTSYAGTGRNIIGTSLMFGHGRPGTILQFDHEIQRRWIEHNSPQEVRKLYDLLISDDQAAIENRIKEIQDEVLGYDDEKN